MSEIVQIYNLRVVKYMFNDIAVTIWVLCMQVPGLT
jgi:hypothetical protein